MDPEPDDLLQKLFDSLEEGAAKRRELDALTDWDGIMEEVKKILDEKEARRGTEA